MKKIILFVYITSVTIFWGQIFAATSAQQTYYNQLNTAHTWAYENQITSVQSLDCFQPKQLINREQAAKMFVQYARATLQESYFNRPNLQINCSFNDKFVFSKDLYMFIIEACRFGIFQWIDRSFYPQNNLTDSQANTVLTRISNKTTSTGTQDFITRGDLVIKMYNLYKSP